MKSRLRLRVRVYGTQVGTLERDPHGQIHFYPDGDWLVGGQIPPLGLALQGDPSPRRAGSGLPCWFENLLPSQDSPLRRRLLVFECPGVCRCLQSVRVRMEREHRWLCRLPIPTRTIRLVGAGDVFHSDSDLVQREAEGGHIPGIGPLFPREDGHFDFFDYDGIQWPDHFSIEGQI